MAKIGQVELSVLDAALARVDRKLGEVTEMLSVEGRGNKPLGLRTEEAAERLRHLAPVQRGNLILRAALALADLDDLVGALQQHLLAIREELEKLNGHSRAALAYSRQDGAKGQRRTRQ